LMLRKWNYKEKGYHPGVQVPEELHDPADGEVLIRGRPRVGSLPARPEFKEANPDDLRVGSGAAARFEKRHRMSHNLTKTGAGTLEELAAAMSSNGSSSDSMSSSSGSSTGNSPTNGNISPISSAYNKRNTMEPYRSNGENGKSRPILTGSTSPPSPMRPRSPHTTTTQNVPNGTNSPTAHQGNGKRRSLILSGFENFKSLIKTDKDRSKSERVEPVPENRRNTLAPGGSDSAPESRRRSSTIVGIESAFKSLLSGSDKVKQVSGVFNVDTTTTQSPQQVMEEIRRVLDFESTDGGEFQMQYKLKGYVFKCTYPGRKLKFQLEICRIKNLDLTGVKLKRLKGDLWVYKEYCQRLMAKMRL